MTLALLAGCAPRLQDPGPAGLTGDRLPAAILSTADGGLVFQAEDGAALPLRHWPAEGETAAVILALHGMNDYGNAFAMPAKAWAKAGIATYAPDQRGFGAAPEPGIWAGTERLADDAAALARALALQHPGRPLLLLGESMGGAVALVALSRGERLPIAGTVLAAPAVWGRSTMPMLQSGLIWIAAHTMPWKEIWAEGLDIRPSDNIPMLRALGRDPLVLKRTRADAVWGLANLMDAALAAGSLFPADLPLLIVYGGRDDLIPRAPTLDFIRSLTARQPGADGTPPRQRVAIYPEGYHMLLRDKDGARAWADIAAFVNDPGAALPSGADRVDAEALLRAPPPPRGAWKE